MHNEVEMKRESGAEIRDGVLAALSGLESRLLRRMDDFEAKWAEERITWKKLLSDPIACEREWEEMKHRARRAQVGSEKIVPARRS